MKGVRMAKFLTMIFFILSFCSISQGAEHKISEQKIRIGIVGLGNHMEENILPSLKLITGLEFVFCSCTSIEKAELKAWEHNFQMGTVDWKSMLSKQFIDAVIVSGPPQLHTMVAAHAIANGIHVFTEKPLSINPEDSDRLYHLLQGNPEVITSVGFNFIHTKLHSLVEGLKEEASLIKLKMHSSKPSSPLWGGESIAESFIYAVGIHGISILVNLFGEHEQVNANLIPIGENMFSMLVTVRFMNKKVAVLDFGNYSSRFVNEIELVTNTKRKMFIDTIKAPIFLYNFCYKLI